MNIVSGCMNPIVQAFGITDYFSADGYLTAHVKFRERYPDSGKIFFQILN